MTSDASCQFAENIFYEAWNQWNNGSWDGQGETSISAYSPVTGETYSVSCQNSEGSGAEIICTNNSAPTAEAEFSLAAIEAYTQSEASAYASSGALGP